MPAPYKGEAFARRQSRRPLAGVLIYFPSNDVIDFMDYNSKRAQLNVIFYCIASDFMEADQWVGNKVLQILTIRIVLIESMD